MRVHKQKTIKSETCGNLRSIFESDNPDLSIVTAENLKKTVPHFHKKSVEIYWCLKGNLEIVIHKRGQKENIVKLHEGDVLEVEAGEIHSVIKSSRKNKVVVICVPAWNKADEYILN